jgi:hypothetical protein
MISMMIGSEFIFALTHPLAKNQVGERHRKKYNRHSKKDRILHHKFLSRLKLDHDSHINELLVFAQIGKPYAATLRCAGRLRRAEGLLHG